MPSIVGIPGTISEEAARLRWVRGQDIAMGRSYSAETSTGTLYAIVAQDLVDDNLRPLWHVSVQHKGRDKKDDRLPTWDELKSAAYRLVHADVPFVIVFPRRSSAKNGTYVNLHDNVLHLWESADKTIDQ